MATLNAKAFALWADLHGSAVGANPPAIEPILLEEPDQN
jgi:hypothetical protein